MGVQMLELGPGVSKRDSQSQSGTSAGGGEQFRAHRRAKDAAADLELRFRDGAGWRFQSFDAGFWIEPALAFNAWPIETGRPDSFREKDERWPSYYLVEPWLNVGWSW